VGAVASTLRDMLADLPDARRAAKPWLPADDRDVTNGLVRPGPDGKPECARHGAMNRVDPYRRFYRCQEMRCGAGAEYLPDPEPSLSWYKVEVTVLVQAPDAADAQDFALSTISDRSDPDHRRLATAPWPQELTAEKTAWVLRLLGVLDQADRDIADEALIPVAGCPGVLFAPGAAAALAALRFEAGDGE
jgi:hypothetical protein